MNKKNLICFSQCVTAGIVGAFITHILIQYFGGLIETCNTNEPSTQCVREWVSALSGWVAAGGALVAALLTLPHLRKQAAEAKRQTDFIVGDAEPEIILQRNRSKETVTLIITNWNRRRVIIEEANASSSSTNKIEIHNMIAYNQYEYPSVEALSKQIKKSNYDVNGWINREQPPKQRRIALSFRANNDFIHTPATSIQSLKLTVKYKIVGQTHSRHEVTVSALDWIDIDK